MFGSLVALVGELFAFIGELFAFVGGLLPLVESGFASVGGLVAPVGYLITLVRNPVALIRHPFALVGRRIPHIRGLDLHAARNPILGRVRPLQSGRGPRGGRLRPHNGGPAALFRGIETLAPLVGSGERGVRAEQAGSGTIDKCSGVGLVLHCLGSRGPGRLDALLGVGDAPVAERVEFNH